MLPTVPSVLVGVILAALLGGELCMVSASMSSTKGASSTALRNLKRTRVRGTRCFAFEDMTSPSVDSLSSLRESTSGHVPIGGSLTRNYSRMLLGFLFNKNELLNYLVSCYCGFGVRVAFRTLGIDLGDLLGPERRDPDYVDLSH